MLVRARGRDTSPLSAEGAARSYPSAATGWNWPAVAAAIATNWAAADVMKETNSHPPALVETPNVRAINDGIQAQLAEPIEISDSDSD